KIFAVSFRKLCSKMFPRYDFRRLPLSHPIFDEQFHAAKWKQKYTLEGMGNGVRELAILIPDGDPGKAWQIEATKSREEAFQLGANIFVYATGKEDPHRKGDSHIVSPEPGSGREIKIARIEAGENFDPEPGGWRRIAAILHNSRRIDLRAEPVKIGD